MGLMRHIHRLNAVDPTKYRKFMVGWRSMGLVTDTFSEVLKSYPQTFQVTEETVSFLDSLATPEARTEAMAAIAKPLAASGAVVPLVGETYAAKNNFMDQPEFHLDRALVAYFGLRAYGIHINGFVKRPDGPQMWLARRAADRNVEPNKLDNMVAGGQPADLSLMDNLIKECAEEADISESLARTAKPVSTITYHMETSKGLKPDCMFCYDLEMPPEVTPKPVDGEVSEFFLIPAKEALDLVRETDDYKFNVNLVVIDFALRHGLIDPDREPHFEALIAGLRVGDHPFG